MNVSPKMNTFLSTSLKRHISDNMGYGMLKEHMHRRRVCFDYNCGGAVFSKGTFNTNVQSIIINIVFYYRQTKTNFQQSQSSKYVAYIGLLKKLANLIICDC